MNKQQLLQRSVGVDLASEFERTKRSVFSLRLKVGSDGESVTANGRLFQMRAAATGNAGSPIVECTTSAVVDADRSRRLESTSATRWSSVERYDGARPSWQRNARTANLYAIRSGARSQWRSRNSGVTWSYFRAEQTSRAAAFKTDWSLSSSWLGRPGSERTSI